MKTGFYPRLAWTGICKNRQFYLPYILTCIGMVTMQFIVTSLHGSGVLRQMPGGTTITEMMSLGKGIVAVFAVLFLFYTNSFLMRRRKKEFGLYNMLGMGKRHIALILAWETLIIAAISLLAGVCVGGLFEKFAELLLTKLIRGGASYAFTFSLRAAGETALVFGIVFLLIFLNALRQISLSDPIALLRSEQAGEKPPRANWFIGLLGVLLIAVAYYIAVSIREPLSALMWFFVAVAMVIVGTYALFIAGSVLLCRILQKNKRFYYRADRFVSVSSLAFRMKRNGAGLASICILATMVLVMITGSAGLYFGSEDSLHARYPRDIVADLHISNVEALWDGHLTQLRGQIDGVLSRYGTTAEDLLDYRTVNVTGVTVGDRIEVDVRSEDVTLTNLDAVRQFYFVPLEDYNAITGMEMHLNADEVMISTVRCQWKSESVTLPGGSVCRIAGQTGEFIRNSYMAMNMQPSVIFVLPDLAADLQPLLAMTDYNGEPMATIEWVYAFACGCDSETTLQVVDDLKDLFHGTLTDKGGVVSGYSAESLEANRADFYSTFGSIFFLGLLLSVVFLFATVLIIYYKQITEGYEDQARFGIMQKVGMTRADIRRSINSQMLIVFFLPLGFAVAHLAFAFPMLRKLLMLFNLFNLPLLLVTAGISVLVFIVFYVLVYRLTSNAYFAIVSGAKE